MAKTFDLPLNTSIVPAYAAGSATPTFTRATTATIIDHEGMVRYCKSGEARFYGRRRVHNLLAEQAGSTSDWNAWSKSNIALTTGIDDPYGGNTAVRIEASGGTGIFYCVSGNPFPTSAMTGCASIWARRVTGSSTVTIFKAANAAEDITAGLTTEWKRFSGTGAFPGGNGYCGINEIANGDIIDVALPQLEIVSGQSNQAPGEWISFGAWGSGAAPYHGANVDGVKYFDTENGNSVASNVVTEATGAALTNTIYGYLSEGQRTNRCLYSEDASNAAWVKTNITIAANSVAAPDGATTADTLTATAGNATMIQDLGVVASANKTGSVWLKRKTGTGNIQLTMDNGTGWTTVAVGGTWTRFSLDQTLANEDFGIRIVTSGDAVYFWGGMVTTLGNSLSWLMSYVPTTSAAVTANEDLLMFAPANNISVTVGTAYAEFVPDGIPKWAERILGEGNNSFMTINGSLSIFDGINSMVNHASPGTLEKAVTQWLSGGNKRSVMNGTSSTPNAYAGMTTAILYIGGATSDEKASIPFRNVRIWDQVLVVDETGNVVESDALMFMRRRRR